MNKSKKSCLKKKFDVLQKARKVKGTNDLFGNEILYHNQIKSCFDKICTSFNFKEISTPILEHSEIFTKSLGISSDIVLKEMYSFVDKGNDHLVLRPEGTAATARAVITNSLEQETNKLFYKGPMFRREKPQSGRLRQFHQVGVEYLGSENYVKDLEIIIIAENFLKELGIRDKVTFEINSLGNDESRKKYNCALKEFLKKNANKLSDSSKERLEKNPMRVLDSKDPQDQALIKKSPSILDFLDLESKDFFKDVVNSLDKMKINYKLNRFLVRGLDYYNHTAFEYITREQKSQNALLAGGRYNGLVKSLGGSDLAGVGWAAGIERIVMNLEKIIDNNSKIICFFTTTADLDKELLKVISDIKLKSNIKINLITSGGLKKKFIKANKVGAHGCIVLGESEWESKKVIWKDFVSGQQELIDLIRIEEFLSNKF